MSEANDEFVCGYPEFSPKIFAAYGPAISAANEDSGLANRMLAALPSKMNRDQIIVYLLVRLTFTGWIELLILVVNGAGLGAMKISRGMFESGVMAEYLRQNPAEIQDFAEYAWIISYKRVKQYGLQVASPETLANVEKQYKKVKPRFTNPKGKVRPQWNKHPISYMAEKIGRADQYDLSYSLAASIHHGNAEAVIAHLSGRADAVELDQPPSLVWIDQALMSGHIYLLQALDTLNDQFNLGFDADLKRADTRFQSVWKRK